MPKGKSLDDLLAAAEKIVRVWDANTEFKLGEIKLADLKAMVAELRGSRGQTEETRRQLTALVNATNTKAEAMAAVLTRALSGIRAYYGPDSSQYEEAGGTRLSDRKRAAKKKPTS